MNSRIIANGILRALGIITGIVAVLYLFNKIQSLLIYVVIALILSLIARPFIRFLRFKLKLPNVLAVVITMVVFLATVMGIISTEVKGSSHTHTDKRGSLILKDFRTIIN